jgi:predicted transglutaminase-like cysteine proteinase
MRKLVNLRSLPVLRPVLAVGLVLAAGSYSFGLDNDRMVVLGRTSQPIGHFNYCREHPEDCVSNAASPLAPELTNEKWSQMIEINHHANIAVTPVTDMEQYSKEEYWTLPSKYGDCEDYVLLKRKLLIKRGWPVSSLLVTVVRQRTGEGHAVLTVRTSKSDYILDNLNGKILPWNKTEYQYLKRQSTMHSGRWSDIADTRNIVGAIK